MAGTRTCTEKDSQQKPEKQKSNFNTPIHAIGLPIIKTGGSKQPHLGSHVWLNRPLFKRQRFESSKYQMFHGKTVFFDFCLKVWCFTVLPNPLNKKLKHPVTQNSSFAQHVERFVFCLSVGCHWSNHSHLDILTWGAHRQTTRFPPMLCNESSNIRDGPAGARHLLIFSLNEQWKMGPWLVGGYMSGMTSYSVI